MPLTVPDDINYPDTDYAGGFVTAMGLMSTSVQSALSVRAAKSYRWPNQAARDAESGMVIDNRGYQEDNDKSYRFNGSIWVEEASGIACALRKSANQNLTTTATALSWDVEVSDPSGIHSNVTNNTRLTAPVAGLYEIASSIYNNNTSGLGTLQARVNGTTDAPGSLERRTADAAGLSLRNVFSLAMAPGDYVEIMVLHATAAGSVAGGTANGSATVSMKRIGA